MQKLTNRQSFVLMQLKKHLAQKGYPPTVRELCEKTNLSSTATIQVHLDKLVEKGYIKKDPDKNRTIELLVPNEFSINTDSVVLVPLLGKVNAGNPIEAIETPNEYFELPVNLINNRREVFTLRVNGDSMINAGIYDDDVIIVERGNTVNNGEKVVAMNEENEATVKTYYKEKNHIRLQPENDNMDPIILKDVTILGKVVGLYRKI